MAKGHGSYIRKADEFYLKHNIISCFYCGSNEDLAIDHIIPPMFGGNSNLSNLTRACRRCNSYKGNRTIDVFLNNIIKHRQEIHRKTISKCYILKKHNNRGTTPPQGVEWYSNKIRFGRKEHSYFTSIIKSLVNKEYFLI